MKKIIDVDGEVYVDDAKISIFNGGFYFGLGIYETILIYNKVPIFFDEHITRMKKAISFFELKIEEYFFTELQRRIKMLLSRAIFSLDLARLRIIISPSEISFPNIKLGQINSIMVLSESKFSLKNNYRLYITEIVKNSMNPIPCYVKLTANHRNLMAAKVSMSQGFDEALVFNDQGYVCEASYANIFFIRDRSIITPSLENNLLDGVTRKKVIKVVQELGLDLTEGSISYSDLFSFDSAFITSSTRGVKNVEQIAVDEKFIKHFQIKKPTKIINYSHSAIIDQLDKSYDQLVKSEEFSKKQAWY